jgi:hypothetical protein
MQTSNFTGTANVSGLTVGDRTTRGTKTEPAVTEFKVIKFKGNTVNYSFLHSFTRL